MRILHLGKYYPPAPGGIESHVQTMALGQSELGHQVKVICVNHADQDGRDITHSRWRRTISTLDQDGTVQVIRIGRLFGVNRLEVCPGLLKTISRATREADIVHLHTPNPLMLVAWWIAGDRTVSLVVTHHSDVIKQRLLKSFVAPIESQVYRLAGRILSDSPSYIEGSSVLQAFGNKVETLPLGIELDSYLNPSSKVTEGAEKFKKENGFPLWLMVGRMTYYKGYHVAIEALTKVPGRLIIVGNGPLEKELQARAKEQGVASRITWKSSVSQEELITLYHAATALWFPSVARSEGFGLVQVEAMACGCPVINTYIPGSGVSWVSKNNESGITVMPNDSSGLGGAANIICNEPELRKRLGEGAKKRACILFSGHKMAAESIRVYESLS